MSNICVCFDLVLMINIEVGRGGIEIRRRVEISVRSSLYGMGGGVVGIKGLMRVVRVIGKLVLYI